VPLKRAINYKLKSNDISNCWVLCFKSCITLQHFTINDDFCFLKVTLKSHFIRAINFMYEKHMFLTSTYLVEWLAVLHSANHNQECNKENYSNKIFCWIAINVPGTWELHNTWCKHCVLEIYSYVLVKTIFNILCNVSKVLTYKLFWSHSL